MRKLKLTPLPMPKRAVPVRMSLTDKNLPAEIRQRIEKNNVQSNVFRDKTDRVNANYTITFINENKTSQFVSYEESTFWFSLPCTVGYALPNPKL